MYYYLYLLPSFLGVYLHTFVIESFLKGKALVILIITNDRLGVGPLTNSSPVIGFRLGGIWSHIPCEEQRSAVADLTSSARVGELWFDDCFLSPHGNAALEFSLQIYLFQTTSLPFTNNGTKKELGYRFPCIIQHCSNQIFFYLP